MILSHLNLEIRSQNIKEHFISLKSLHFFVDRSIHFHGKVFHPIISHILTNFFPNYISLQLRNISSLKFPLKIDEDSTINISGFLANYIAEMKLKKCFAYISNC